MKRILFVIAALMPVAGFSQDAAVPLRYDYVGGSLLVPALDEIGFALEGSTAVTRNLIVFGQYLNYEPNNQIDLTTLQIGVGRVWNFRRNVDFVASVSYSSNNIDTRRRSEFEEEGIVIGGRLKGWATDRIELSGATFFDRSRGSNTDTVVELGVQYFTEPRLSYGGKLRVDENDSSVSLGVRFYFGASRRPIGP